MQPHSHQHAGLGIVELVTLALIKGHAALVDNPIRIGDRRPEGGPGLAVVGRESRGYAAQLIEGANLSAIFPQLQVRPYVIHTHGGSDPIAGMLPPKRFRHLGNGWVDLPGKLFALGKGGTDYQEQRCQRQTTSHKAEDAQADDRPDGFRMTNGR